MSVATRAGGLLIASAVILGLVYYAGSGSPADKDRPKRSNRQVPVHLTGTWQEVRDFAITWSANGRRHDEGLNRFSPWERDIVANVGSTVTFIMTPQKGGLGEHTCTIEYPPGHPMPGPGQKTGHGTDSIMCTAVIGA
jgi:hypothetical protein